MFDARAENQNRLAALRLGHDVAAGILGDVGEPLLYLGGNELALPGVYAVQIGLCRAAIGYNRGKPACGDEFAGFGLINQRIKQPIFALGEQPAVQPVRCGGQANDKSEWRLGEYGVVLPGLGFGYAVTVVDKRAIRKIIVVALYV